MSHLESNLKQHNESAKERKSVEHNQRRHSKTRSQTQPHKRYNAKPMKPFGFELPRSDTIASWFQTEDEFDLPLVNAMHERSHSLPDFKTSNANDPKEPLIGNESHSLSELIEISAAKNDNNITSFPMQDRHTNKHNDSESGKTDTDYEDTVLIWTFRHTISYWVAVLFLVLFDITCIHHFIHALDV